MASIVTLHRRWSSHSSCLVCLSRRRWVSGQGLDDLSFGSAMGIGIAQVLALVLARRAPAAQSPLDCSRALRARTQPTFLPVEHSCDHFAAFISCTRPQSRLRCTATCPSIFWPPSSPRWWPTSSSSVLGLLEDERIPRDRLSLPNCAGRGPDRVGGSEVVTRIRSAGLRIEGGVELSCRVSPLI